VPTSIKKRIFDPFVTTKRGEGGSGLGMHLVYNLVTQALDGSITLDEDYAEGTRYVISLPIGELTS
jgi:signal transduction histidine kinase